MVGEPGDGEGNVCGERERDGFLMSVEGEKYKSVIVLVACKFANGFKSAAYSRELHI